VTAPAGALGVAVWVLLSVAAVVVLGSSVGVLLVRELLARLHLLSPVTSVAGPLIGVACALTLGWSTSTAGVLVIVVLLAVTGPVLQAAVARAATVGESAAADEPQAGDTAATTAPDESR
jgi:multisubunit Na+/H+ antiporter MnhG subunit